MFCHVQSCKWKPKNSSRAEDGPTSNCHLFPFAKVFWGTLSIPEPYRFACLGDCFVIYYISLNGTVYDLSLGNHTCSKQIWVNNGKSLVIGLFVQDQTVACWMFTFSEDPIA